MYRTRISRKKTEVNHERHENTRNIFATAIGTLALAGCTTGFSRIFAPRCNFRQNMQNNEIREIEV